MQWLDDLLDEMRQMIREGAKKALTQYKPVLSRASGTLPPENNTPPAQMPDGGFVPADGSVTEVKLADGAVTEAKLSFDPATQAELDAHLAAPDPHTQYQTETEGDARYLQLASVSLTPGANIVPRAGVAGKLATGWIPAIDLATMISGTLAIANGGTGATTAAAALTNLGAIRNAGNIVSAQAGLDLGKGSPGTAGRVYVATDALRIYRDNGATWQLIGSVNWSDLQGTPLTFAPSAHASSHASGGSDPVTPAAIGAAASSHTHAAGDITSGTLDDARHSANMARLATVQTFTAAQRFDGRLAVGEVVRTNVQLSLGGTLSGLTGNAFTMYTGAATHAPATGFSSFSLYGGGTVVDTGVSNTITAAYAGYFEPPTKTGTGTISTAYGIRVGKPTVGTTNITAWLDGTVGIGRSPTAAGADLDVNAGIAVNGTKVVGPRGAAITAPAATIADCQRAINDIISRMQAHGSIA